MNDTRVLYDFMPVTAMFEREAAAHPDKPAAVSAAACYTYGELNAAANRTAEKLIDFGIRADDIVMILLERGVETYAANLGILKAGGAYICVGAKYPDERIDFIFRDSGAKAVITSAELLESRRELIESLDTKVFLLEEMTASGCKEDPGVAIAPEQLCYCIYTSGSTGRPKGVMIEHGNLTNFVWPSSRNHEAMSIISRAHVLLAMAQMTFDVSVMEEFLALTSGLTAAVASDEEILNASLMKDFILRFGVDAMCATPAYISALIGLAEMAPAFRQIMTYDLGAEAFPPSLYERMTAVNPGAYIMNGYGPTETTISCTMKVITSGENITIGVPNANVYAWIIDENGREAKPGEIGELLIGGMGVGRGYIGLPEKTAAAFISFNGMRAYRTGDLACITEDGEIAYHGRLDNQVKLRGLRIELGEIETVMQTVPGVKQAVCRVREVQGIEHLVAWYVTNGAEVSEDAIRDVISRRLARYMVPDYFMQLDAFPMTANQKIDVRAMPEVTPKAREIVQPADALEEDVLSACRSQIRFEGFGMKDVLGDVGFTSLTLLGFAAYLYDKYGVNLSMPQLLSDECTPAWVCGRVREQQSVSEAGAASADHWPVTPQQMVLTPVSSGHQVDRRVIFPGMTAEGLRSALLRVVNGTPVFSVNFFEEDGVLMQKPAAPALTENDVPIVTAEPSEEDKAAFFTMIGLTDARLCGFLIIGREGESELWMKVHHALIDHAGMKLFLDRIAAAYDDPAADMREKVSYFDYAQALAREKAPARPGAGEKLPFAGERGFTRRMVTMPAEKNGRPDSDLLLTAVTQAAARTLGRKKLTVQYTFGGRSEARYFDTIGYFPYAVPLTMAAKEENASFRVKNNVIRAIAEHSPLNDILYLRLQGLDESLCVLYNYMEKLGGTPEDRYTIRDEHIQTEEDGEALSRIQPHIEFNCVSNGALGMMMLDHDPAVLSPEQAEALLALAEKILTEEL